MHFRYWFLEKTLIARATVFLELNLLTKVELDNPKTKHVARLVKLKIFKSIIRVSIWNKNCKGVQNVERFPPNLYGLPKMRMAGKPPKPIWTSRFREKNSIKFLNTSQTFSNLQFSHTVSSNTQGSACSDWYHLILPARIVPLFTLLYLLFDLEPWGKQNL